MDIIYKIIFGLLFLSVLVCIHEFGHYIVGKKCGIGVLEFAIGFGPKIWSTEKNDTVYSIRCIPLGGYTAFEGEDDDSDSPTAMNNVSVSKRIATILAGPVFNIVFAILVSTLLLFTQGEVNSKITQVAENGNAMAAGMQAGDVITDVNGRSTVFSMEVSGKLYTLNNQNKTAKITVDRNGETHVFDVPFNENGQIGIAMGNVEKYGLGDAFVKSIRWGYAVAYDTFAALKGLFTHTQPLKDVGGTIAIIDILGTSVHYGMYTVLRIAVLISFSLGIMNLLPVPALDGGRLVFCLYELITKRPIDREVEGKIHFGGFVVLFGLMLLLVFNDILNIFVR